MNSNIKLLTISTLVGMSLAAQAQTNLQNKANKQYDRLSYRGAADLYEKVLIKNKDNKEAQIRLADCYRRLGDNINAERVYSQVVTSNDAPAESNLYYAQALSSNGKYADAKKWYDKYSQLRSDDMRGKDAARAYENMSSFYKDSSKYVIKFLEINSFASDFAPMYYKDMIVFSSARKEEGAVKRSFYRDYSAFLDLYTTKNFNGSVDKGYKVGKSQAANKATKLKNTNNTGWTEQTFPTPYDSDLSTALEGRFLPEKAYDVEGRGKGVEKFSKKVNTKYHEGPIAFNKDQTKALLTRNNYNGRARKSNDEIVKLKLYTTEVKDGKWTKAVEVPFNSNEYSVGHATMSPDQNTVYFVSDMPGGKGGTDIYSVDYNNGSWGVPKPVESLNTPGNEMFLHMDNKGGLYFSSDGYAGLGGLDMFYSEAKKGGTFNKPTNMGYPLNSTKDDFSIVVDESGKNGYFASNRKRELGDDDIYSFSGSVPKECPTIIAGTVVDEKDKSIIANADVVLKDAAGKEINRVKADANGKFKFEVVGLCEEKRNYTVVGTKDPYLPAKNSQSVTVQGEAETAPLELSLKQKPPAPVAKIIVRGCAFNKDNGQKIPNAKIELIDQATKKGDVFYTDANGCYSQEVEAGKKYDIEGNAGKELIRDLADITNFSTVGMKEGEIVRDFHFSGKDFEIPNLYYDLDEAYIRPDGAEQLDKLVAILNDYPTMKIELQSHTDCRASAAYNEKLSQRRAKSAYEYVTGQYVAARNVTTNQKYVKTAIGFIKSDRKIGNIDPARITFRGYGESQVLTCPCEGPDSKKQAENCDEATHQKNRRTMVKIISK